MVVVQRHLVGRAPTEGMRMKFCQLLPLTALCIWAVCFASINTAAADVSFGRQIILDRGLQIQSLGFTDSTPLAPSSFSTWSSANFTTFGSWYDTNSEKNLAWTM